MMSIKFWNGWTNFGIGPEKTLSITWFQTGGSLDHYIYTLELTVINFTIQIWGYR